VEVSEIAPGLWRWTGWHEEWKQHVGCVYVETERDVCLIDALVPPEEPASLQYFMRDYVNHLRHHLRQIDPRLAAAPVLQRTRG